MSRNVFFILTPLQLLNAVEAKHALGVESNTLVILTSGYSSRQVRALVDDGEWEQIHDFTLFDEDGRKPNRIVWHYRTYRVKQSLEALAASLPGVHGLFLGNYTDALARHFANVVPHETLYLLDDGTTTLDINHLRQPSPKPAAPLVPLLKRSARNLLLGLRTREADRVTFFSTYDLEVRPGDSLIRNSYSHLRARAARLATNDEVLFLGQPLTEDAQMSEGRYRDYLRSIRAHFRERSFVYAPHKRESREKVRRLERDLELPVREFEFPVEYQLSLTGMAPGVLASFFCTALDNCRLMFGDSFKIAAFYIDPSDLDKERDFVESVYAYLRTHSGPGFEVLTLPRT